MALNLSEGSKKNGSFRVARLGPDKVGEAEFLRICREQDEAETRSLAVAQQNVYPWWTF